MMHSFLSENRAELIARCKAKVAARPLRAATEIQLETGMPLFLDQLTRTLEAEEAGRDDASLRISGPAGGVEHAQSEMGVSAAAHGGQLLSLGFTIDQVVHDYGDLCQTITDLAQEIDAPFATDEFRTLNRCLDNAIADAVTEFSFQRDAAIESVRLADAAEHLREFAYEFRNGLQTALVALSVLETGTVPISGATGMVLKRSLASLGQLMGPAVENTPASAPEKPAVPLFSLARFISEAQEAAMLMASESGCKLVVSAVDPTLGIQVNYQLIQSALTNLLNNAFKFTHPRSEIALTAYGLGDCILISVQDMCGGLPAGDPEAMFSPQFQRSGNRPGLGLGLSVARRAVERDGGTVGVRDIAGKGCVFTITLPRHRLD